MTEAEARNLRVVERIEAGPEDLVGSSWRRSAEGSRRRWMPTGGFCAN
ncbi:MAG: hypothetical protein H0V21_04190 [Rubrobacter sp.]|nr:hypothetical protein [Rubrobacter sp.]